jgi:quinol monooxygenase YgiN
MVVGTLRILPTPERRIEVLEILRAVQGPVLAQPGCTACHIYEEQGGEPAVVFVERWESREALEAHLRSETYRRILGALELSGGQPDIRFEQVLTSEGMELIERHRLSAGAQDGKGDQS